MRKIAAGWAALALAGLAGGQVHAQNPYRLRQVEVAPSPVHAIPDDDDAAPGPANDPAESEAPNMGPLAGQSAVLRAPVEDVSAPTPAPASVPAGPTVSLAHEVIDAAGAFDAYVRRASAIDSHFSSGPAVAKAVRTGAAYESHQLQQGAIAYAALVALQDPLFVQVVNDVGENPANRVAFIQQLTQNPGAVLEAPAAQAEAARVAIVLSRLGGSLFASGQAVKQSAYDMQHEPWSKEAVAEPDARLARVKLISAQPYALSAEDTPRLISAVTAWRRAGVTPVQGYAPTPVVTQGLALAALAVLGAAGEENVGQVAPLLADATSAQCMKMAKLNLYQCLSVAGPHYEDAYCLGVHGMMETAQCVVAAAGVPAGMDVGPPATQIAAAPAPPRSVLIPVAADPDAGSERASVFGTGAPAAAAIPLAADATAH